MQVIWTNRARITYLTVLDYLDEYWTYKELIKFISKTELIIKTIEKNPRIYPESEIFKGIRKAHIDKNNSMFYEIEESKIYLLTFFDNRQNPNKLRRVNIK